MTKSNTKNKNSSLWELIRYSWKFHRVIFCFFILSTSLFAIAFTYLVSNKNNLLWTRHLKILIDLIPAASFVVCIYTETLLMINFEQDSSESPLPQIAINSLYITTVILALSFIAFYPWKWISPILTIFTSIFIPIALLGKRAPKTIIYKISRKSDKLTKYYKLSKNDTSKKIHSNKNTKESSSMVNKQKDKEIMNYKMSTHNVYYDKLVEARELRNKRCISILSYWSLRRKLVKKYKKEVMEESDRRD